MSSIGGISSSMLSYMQNTQSSQNTQGSQKPPKPEESFSLLDADSSGGLSEAELTAFTEDISAKTGTTISVSDSMDNYDSDSNGVLSQDELGNMMGELHDQIGPPPGGGGGMSPQGAADTYATQQSATEDLFASLLEDQDSEFDLSSLTESFITSA